MQQIISAMVVLYSLCIVVLIGTHQVNMGFCIVLMGIEYLAVLIMNKTFRENAGRLFKRRGKFGEESKYYEAVCLESMAEDIARMNTEGFKYFIRDLLSANGYKVKLTGEADKIGVTMLAKKEKQVWAVNVQHREKDSLQVKNEAVQQIVAAKPMYKASGSMVITNGKFEELAMAQAVANHTIMLDGEQLVNMVRETICAGKSASDTERTREENTHMPDLIK